MKKTLLIVDDEKINRKILLKILEPEYDCLEASNGKEAMDLVYANPDIISAIVLDLQMPVMDGYEFLKEIKADEAYRNIPVIVSSLMNSDKEEIKALALGANDFIPKPYNPEIILHRIKNTISLVDNAAIINSLELDEVTGLLNKQSFVKKVETTLERCPDGEFDLYCVSLNDSNYIYDTLGPSQFEKLLRLLASYLKGMEGHKFILTAHFGLGKFFVLAMKGTCSEECFNEYIEKANAFRNDILIYLHLGIYHIQDKSIPVSAMCSSAELAVSRIEGKYNAIFSTYDNELADLTEREHFVLNNMEKAVREHEFVVYYQPKFDGRDNSIVGAEALVRWKHPERGMIPPSDFIPLFERNGFITKLDRYVWRKVCQDMKEWRENGLPELSVSVNVSRADVYNPNLADILLGLTKEYEIPINRLHLEVTESAYTVSPEQIIIVVSKLRSLGFVIEMDDFGSGYSSLNMLSKMPIDVMKLDLRFVQSETSQTMGQGILKYIIGLAQWLHLAVIAEGVETKQQMESLESMGCVYGQGFYFSRPIPKDDFVSLLGNKQVSEMLIDPDC